MANIYDNYLTRLRKRRQEKPYTYYAQSQIRSLAPAFTELRNEYANRLRRQDLPETLAQDYALKSTRGVAEQYRQIYSEAETKEMERKRQINQQIDEVEFKKEQYEEQKKEEEERKKNSFWKGALQILGTGAGALLAAPTGGMSVLAGAQLGAAAGSVGSAFIGDEVDMPELVSGLGGVISGLSSVETLKTEKANWDWLSSLDLNGMSKEDIWKIMMALSSGMPLNSLNF